MQNKQQALRIDDSGNPIERILEEIAYLESRLAAIGESGDCAYEKALARSYRILIEEKRALLQLS